jgi:hypothetical protein
LSSDSDNGYEQDFQHQQVLLDVGAGQPSYSNSTDVAVFVTTKDNNAPNLDIWHAPARIHHAFGFLWTSYTQQSFHSESIFLHFQVMSDGTKQQWKR